MPTGGWLAAGLQSLRPGTAFPLEAAWPQASYLGSLL